MRYAYVAATAQGSLRRGVWEASSPRELTAALRAQGFFILDVQEDRARRTVFAWWQNATARASTVERALLARHLALMLRSGLTVDRAFQILVTQAAKSGIQNALREVHSAIQKGEALSVACARFPKIFSSLFISILRWGEAGGALPESLERLADQLEKDAQLRSAVRGALIYPAIVVGATVGLGVLMSTFVLPRLITVFESFQLDLPLSTRVFLAGARFLSAYGIFVLAGTLILAILLVLFLRLPASRPFIHAVVLRVPIVGRMIRDVNLARAERILGSLLRSGLPIVEALSITADALTNTHYQRALRAAQGEAQRGLPMKNILTKAPRLFPPLVVQMVAVGEETGRLPEVLLYLADFTEMQVAQTTKNLTTTLEPLLLVFIGLVVGGVALSVITPIYQLTGSFTR